MAFMSPLGRIRGQHHCQWEDSLREPVGVTSFVLVLTRQPTSRFGNVLLYLEEKFSRDPQPGRKRLSSQVVMLGPC